MKNIVELTTEANKAFEAKLKEPGSVYDELNRLPFVLGYIGAEYQELFEILNKIKILVS